MSTRDIIHSFFDAIENRDIGAAAACFADDAPYQNVPHPAVFGPSGVRAMLTNIVVASSEVRWEVINEAYAENRGHLERIDRFVIGGIECAVSCHAVVEVDEATGLITAFRDYVDLTPWRAEVVPALERWLTRQQSADDTHGCDLNTIG
jgi:limonene-1,2-epoxide hydrolase